MALINSRRDALKAVGYTMSSMVISSAARAIGDAPSSPVVATQYGRIAGYRDNGILVFKGIPYGGDTRHCRFQAPTLPESWTGIRDTQQFGAACPQLNAQEKTNEDCLLLNIWTPNLSEHAKRPVLVYIHGGEFSSGSGSDPLYDGTRLCSRGDVVVITINHRLGVLGHLYLGLSDAEKFKSSGNAGLLDVVLALRWIKGHVHLFGGNADCVTLFGQSGGGAKIACLMAMPSAHGLFHRVMTMSGQQITVSGPRVATNRTHTFFKALQVSDFDVVSLLQQPVEKIIEASAVHDPALANRSLYFGPVLDDRTLHQHPFFPEAPLLSRNIPMIIGNTHDETRYFYARDDSVQNLDWNELRHRLTDAMYVDIDADKVIAAYRQHYPTYTPSEIFFAASTAGRSWRGAIIEAELRAHQGAPAFVYQLDYQSPLDSGKWRACHTLDIPLVFNNIDATGSKTGVDARAQKVSMMMCDALIQFAKTGNPNHVRMPRWSPYTLPHRGTMIFDVAPRLTNDPRSFERTLFAQVPYIQRGTY